MDIVVVANGANVLGRRGENNATRLLFPIASWKDEYGAGGYFQLVAQRQDDIAPYPVEIETDDKYVYWTITSADTAVVGNGICELYYYVGDTLAKSVIYKTIVFETMDEPGAPPEPYVAWVEQVHQYAEAAEAAAEAAASVASHPPVIGENGNWYLWNGTEYEDSGISGRGTAGQIVGLTAVAETLDPDDDAVVSVQMGGTPEQRTFNFDFGIPRGEKGEQGAMIDKNTGRELYGWIGTIEEYNALPGLEDDTWYWIKEPT